MHPNSTDKALAHDIKTTCYHEAGHLIALFELDGIGHLRLGKVSPVDDNDRLISGRCYILKMPDTEIDIAKVGLAGVVAECILSDGLELDWFEFLDRLEMGVVAPSATDWRHIGNHAEAIAKDTIELLVKNWDAVVGEAECEIQNLEAEYPM